MGASKSKRDVRASVESSEGRRDDMMRGVGVGGDDGERSSIGGAGKGGGEGLGSGREVPWCGRVVPLGK